MTDTIASTPNSLPEHLLPKKKGAPKGEVNKLYIAEVASSRKVVIAARDPANAPKLASVELPVALLAQIDALASQVEANLGTLQGARAARKAMTAQETTARKELLGVLQPIQTAAKRKFGGDAAKLREAYYIGASLGGLTLDQVLGAARSVLSRLTTGADNTPPQDVLPGVTPAGAIKDLTDAITQYGGKDAAQSQQTQKASATLEAIEVAVAKLADLRKQVQLAADQAWPWRMAGVATIRKSFLLPATRPIKE